MTRPTDRQQERGMAAVFTVLGFLALTLVVGMSTDFGILLRYRRAMQNACDSGALAGGLNLRSSPSTVTSTAQQYAESDMRRNAISWGSVDATAMDLYPAPTGIDTVRVVINSVVPMYFLRLVRDSVPVAVACRATLTPIILGPGLEPIGVSYDYWTEAVVGPGCLPLIEGGVPLADRPPPCNSTELTLGVADSASAWGAGNSGMLSMQAPGATGDCFDDCPVGANQWQSTFEQGTPQSYCFDQGHTAAVSDYTLDGRSCANVRTRPGTVTGPVINAVDYRCDSPNLLDRVITIALLNPAFTFVNGAATVEIWGFAAYELDCTNRPSPGSGTVTIHGGFVSFVSMQATGQPSATDTGVYTIRLTE